MNLANMSAGDNKNCFHKHLYVAEMPNVSSFPTVVQRARTSSVANESETYITMVELDDHHTLS